MDAFFPDPNVQRQPPDAVRLLRLKATPLVDRKRVQVRLELTPFEKPPEIELNLLSPQGEPCGSTHILEPFTWKLAFTLHLRLPALPAAGVPAAQAGKYTLSAVVSYPEIGQVASRSTTFTLPEVTS